MWDPFKTLKQGVNNIGGKLVNILKEDEEGEQPKSDEKTTISKSPDPEQKKSKPKPENPNEETPKKLDQGLPKVMSTGKPVEETIESPMKSKSVPSSENKLPKYEAKINELQKTIDEKDEALAKFAIMNDKLMKEKLEVQNQNKELKEKLKSAEDNLLQMSYKAHNLQENINLLTSQLEEYKKLASASPIKTETPKNEEISNAKIAELVKAEVEAKEAEIFKKGVENIIQKLNNYWNSDETFPNEIREKLTNFLNNPDVVSGIKIELPETKIVHHNPAVENELRATVEKLNREKSEFFEQLVELKTKYPQLEHKYNDLVKKHEENEAQLKTLKEEAENTKNLLTEANKLKTSLEEQVKLLNEDISTKLSEFEAYKIRTEKSLEHVANDTIKNEQELEAVKDQLENANASLKGKEKEVSDKILKIKELEESLAQIAGEFGALKVANTELKDSNELLKKQMRDFEESVSEIGKENEKNSTEMDKLKKDLLNEKKNSKEMDSTINVNFKTNVIAKLAKLQAFTKNFEIEKVIAPKLVEQNKRFTIQSFLQGLEEGINAFSDALNKRVLADIEDIKKKEKEKADALAANVSKLQTDLNNSAKREKDISISRDEIRRKLDEYQQTVDSMTSTLNTYSNKIKEQEKSLREANDQQAKLNDEIKTKVQEINKLRNQIKTMEDEIKNKKSALSNLESDLSALPEMAGKLEKSVAEIANLKEIISAKNSEIDTLNLSISNLQTIMEENDQLKENLSRKYDEQIKKIRNELDQANRKNLMFDQAREKYESMEKDNEELAHMIKDLTFKLKQSEQEKNEIKTECSSLVQRARNEVSNKEIWVDKRVVSSLLVKYFDLKATLQIKLQILETLSHILSFSSEEREKVGLHKSRLEIMKNRSDADNANQGDDNAISPSLKDKFISFLNGKE